MTYYNWMIPLLICAFAMFIVILIGLILMAGKISRWSRNGELQEKLYCTNNLLKVQKRPHLFSKDAVSYYKNTLYWSYVVICATINWFAVMKKCTSILFITANTILSEVN